MASDRRSSISSIRSAISRASISSSQRPATPPAMTDRRPPSPLNQPSPGVPTLSPPSIGKASLPPPMTPQRKPVQRQKSPLSAEAFSSPTQMPGGFPEEEGPATPVQTQEDTTTPNSKSGKRLSSMTKFLPFKAMRRSYDASSPQSASSPSTEPMRPKTPGADSVASNSKPSLRKRVSGTFWRRKSSLGLGFTPGDEDAEGRPKPSTDLSQTTAGADASSSPRTNGVTSHETIREDSRPSSPTLADSSPLPKKRKSGTFWRRANSLTLQQTMNAEKASWTGRKASLDQQPMASTNTTAPTPVPFTNGHRDTGPPTLALNPDLEARAKELNGAAAATQSKAPPPEPTTAEERDSLGKPPLRKTSTAQNGAAAAEENGQNGDNKQVERTLSNKVISALPVGRKTSDRKPLPPKPRTPSPPPQLPPFVGAGGGLGLDEDWLKGF